MCSFVFHAGATVYSYLRGVSHVPNPQPRFSSLYSQNMQAWTCARVVIYLSARAKLAGDGAREVRDVDSLWWREGAGVVRCGEMRVDVSLLCYRGACPEPGFDAGFSSCGC